MTIYLFLNFPFCWKFDRVLITLTVLTRTGEPTAVFNDAVGGGSTQWETQSTYAL